MKLDLGLRFFLMVDKRKLNGERRQSGDRNQNDDRNSNDDRLRHILDGIVLARNLIEQRMKNLSFFQTQATNVAPRAVKTMDVVSPAIVSFLT